MNKFWFFSGIVNVFAAGMNATCLLNEFRVINLMVLIGCLAISFMNFHKSFEER